MISMQDTVCLYRVPVTSVYSESSWIPGALDLNARSFRAPHWFQIPVAPPPPTEMWVKLDCVRTVFMFGELGLTNKTARLVLTIHSCALQLRLYPPQRQETIHCGFLIPIRSSLPEECARTSVIDEKHSHV